MIKQLFFTFSILACGNALSMSSTFATARAAGARNGYVSASEDMRKKAEAERLIQLLDVILDYAARGAPSSVSVPGACRSSSLDDVKEYLKLTINLTDTVLEKSGQEVSVYQAVLSEIHDKYALIDFGAAPAFSELMRKEINRLNEVKDLFDKHLFNKNLKDCSVQPLALGRAPAIVRNPATWSISYSRLLGGLGIVAVLATVIQYQRSKDRK